jgi:hypothetical protein
VKIVTVTINESDASFSVDLQGFHGKGCDAVIKAFSGDAKITKEIHHPEYHRMQTAAKPQTQTQTK